MRHIARQRIGLLGGSFNPPHEGHIHISRQAQKRLFLDEIWWVISPRNPLKDLEPASFLTRKSKSVDLIKTLPIVVSDFEIKKQSRYSINTIRGLKRNYPNLDFVWLMGSDSLIEFHCWKEWQQMFQTIPIVIFSRYQFDLKGMRSKAARVHARAFMPLWRFPRRGSPKLPAWTFVKSPTKKISSTQLRQST